jgi:hypothetical protein
MAKLSARGRTEIARYVKLLPDSDLATERQRVLVLMSDNWILQCHKCRFKSDGLPYNSGWKQFQKLHKTTPSEFAVWATNKGYIQEK